MSLPSLAGLPSAVRRAFDGELDRGNAVLFAPVFMAAGALAYFALRDEPAFVPLLLCLVLAAGLSVAASARPLPRAALLAATMVFAGMLAGKIETWRADTPMLGAEITTRLTARVVRVEHQASGRVRLTLDVLTTERPALRYAPSRVRATARAVPEGLAPGDAVRGVVRLMPPSGPVRPHSYDFAFESYFSGIGAVGFFLSGVEVVAADAPPGLRARLAAWMEGWRGRMAERIERRIGGPEGAVAAALITGVRAGIPEELNEALRVAGLYHVISISGLHMALVAGTLMVSLRAALALAPSFSMRRPVKKYAAACALFATGFYLVLSGGDVAAQRSFIMLAVMLAAVIFDRAALTMRNLALSALIILALSPHEVVGPSFQMSFAATAALVAAYAAWRDRRERRPARARAAASLPAAALRQATAATAGLAMTAVVAGIATALFTAWHFQQVSPLGLVANLAAMPVVSVVVMPMAVLAALAMPFGLETPPLWLMGQGIAAMNAIARWLAGHSAFDATGAIPLPAVLVLTAALAVLTMAESALRWASLPLIALGIGLIAGRGLPDAFVAEDASLVALRLSDGRIAVNRARPRAFTIDNWQRAFGGGEIVPPRNVDKSDADQTRSVDGNRREAVARDTGPSPRQSRRAFRSMPASEQGPLREGAGSGDAARPAIDVIAPPRGSRGPAGGSRTLRAGEGPPIRLSQAEEGPPIRLSQAEESPPIRLSQVEGRPPIRLPQAEEGSPIRLPWAGEGLPIRFSQTEGEPPIGLPQVEEGSPIRPPSAEEGRTMHLRQAEEATTKRPLIAEEKPTDRSLRADDNPATPQPAAGGSLAAGGAAPSGKIIALPAAGAGFSCADGLCVARRADGVVVAHAANADAAAAACGAASLIVIADATATNPCAAGGTAVVTARDLARHGSAEIAFSARDARQPRHDDRRDRHNGQQDGQQGRHDTWHGTWQDHGIAARPPLRAVVRFAITEPYRPWHAHRRYSREARGLAPYQPPRRQQSSARHPSPPEANPSGMNASGTGLPGMETDTATKTRD